MRDMDKLNAAFKDLNAVGVLTFPNFYCCGGCASGAVATAYEAAPDPATVGAVYFHEQGAERAIDGGGLTLYYGALPDSAARNLIVEVGNRLVAALRSHGLAPVWDGNPARAVEVPKFEVELSEIPEGEGSSLHDTYGVEDPGNDWDEEDEG